MTIETPAEEARKLLDQIKTVTSQYGVTDWELNFLKSIVKQHADFLSDKQEAVMAKIRAKVVEAETNEADDEGEIEIGEKALDGQLHFSKRRRKL